MQKEIIKIFINELDGKVEFSIKSILKDEQDVLTILTCLLLERVNYNVDLLIELLKSINPEINPMIN